MYIHLYKFCCLFQYSLIAAYLDPTDNEEWGRLAKMCLEQDDMNQAIKCYTRGQNLNVED